MSNFNKIVQAEGHSQGAATVSAKGSWIKAVTTAKINWTLICILLVLNFVSFACLLTSLESVILIGVSSFVGYFAITRVIEITHS
jgi:hypothetical protein